MLSRSRSGTAPARQAISRFRRPTHVIVIAVLVATGGMLAGVDTAAAAGTGGLSYPPRLLQALPDASENGDGVTGGSDGCPQSHPHPVGGGVNLQGPDPDLDLEVHATGPAGNAWRVQANNSSGSDAQMTIYAICATGQYVYPHQTVSIAPGHTNAAKVSCPAGTKVVGGGVAIIGGDHTAEVGSSEPADGPDANHKIDDAWFGTAGAGADSLSMKVEAVCAKHGSYVVKVGTRTPLPDNDVAISVVLCPAGTRVTGGGVDIDGASTDLELHDGFPIDGSDVDGLPDDGWQSTVYNDGSGELHHMKTFAICKRV